MNHCFHRIATYNNMDIVGGLKVLRARLNAIVISLRNCSVVVVRVILTVGKLRNYPLLWGVVFSVT